MRSAERTPKWSEESGQEPEQASRMARLCHDLRQYVAAGMLLSHVPDDTELDESDRRRLHLINQQFASIAELIASESEAMRPRGRVLDLVKLIDECVEVVRLTHGVSVMIEATTRVTTYGDPALLRRAISNLLDNASRAAGPGGTVTVRAGGTKIETWLEVSDDGAGFGQIPAGTGQGLQIVAAAARASHGRLEIHSGPGPGTTVRLRLPSGRGPVTSS
jgi:signal transduction histidine kinase